jgi:AcrR family transcriptional regulator
MTVQERRAREREELKELILDTARTLFVEEGYEAVTMRRIADRIDYSATALYVHFKDKAALFRELCERDFYALGQRFQELARIADPVERLRQTGLAYVDFALDHPNHYRLMFMTPHPLIEPAQELVRKGNPEEDAYAFLKATLAEGQARGLFRPEFDDLERTAQVMWAGVHGLVSLHIAKCNDSWVDWRSPRESAALLVDALVRGILKD